jgi:hypothetical protein
VGGGRQGVLKKNKNARGHFGKGMIRRGARQELTKVLPLKFKKKTIIQATGVGGLGITFGLFRGGV